MSTKQDVNKQHRINTKVQNRNLNLNGYRVKFTEFAATETGKSGLYLEVLEVVQKDGKEVTTKWCSLRRQVILVKNVTETQLYHVEQLFDSVLS